MYQEAGLVVTKVLGWIKREILEELRSEGYREAWRVLRHFLFVLIPRRSSGLSYIPRSLGALGGTEGEEAPTALRDVAVLAFLLGGLLFVDRSVAAKRLA